MYQARQNDALVRSDWEVRRHLENILTEHRQVFQTWDTAELLVGQIQVPMRERAQNSPFDSCVALDVVWLLAFQLREFTRGFVHAHHCTNTTIRAGFPDEGSVARPNHLAALGIGNAPTDRRVGVCQPLREAIVYRAAFEDPIVHARVLVSSIMAEFWETRGGGFGVPENSREGFP